jgi:hypothetical protein
MPVKFANTSLEYRNLDFACLRRRFSGPAGSQSWTIALRKATSDDDASYEDERDLLALRDAISSSTNTISYEQFRRQLGLH